MALDFRLAYNTGLDYTDLLPRTKIQLIENAENSLKYSTVTVDIPVTNNMTQVVNVPLTSAQIDAPFDCFLVDATQEAKRSYATIDQIETTKNGLTITRLGFMPETAIQIMLRFKEAGING